MGRSIGCFLRHPLFKLILLTCAVISLIAFGVIGARRGQVSISRNYDVRFFYVGGLCWLKGLSPYNPEVYYRLSPGLVGGPDQGGFFYPPQMAPLSLFLASFSWSEAQEMMTLLNILSVGAIAFFSVRLIHSSDWCFLPAIIIGIPITSNAVWSGQTGLLVTVAVIASWYYARRGRWLLGGIFLAVATIKPQLSFFIVLWMLLERRWWLLGVTSLTIIVLSLVPILSHGLFTPFLQWFSVLDVHRRLPFNNVGHPGLYNLQNLLFFTGIHVPDLFPLGVMLTLLLWRFRRRFITNDLLGVLLSISILFGMAHDYDLPVLAPLFASFRYYAQTSKRLAVQSLGLLFLLFIPRRFFNLLGIESLQLPWRILLIFVATIWLLVISHQNKRTDDKLDWT